LHEARHPHWIAGCMAQVVAVFCTAQAQTLCPARREYPMIW